MPGGALGINVSKHCFSQSWTDAPGVESCKRAVAQRVTVVEPHQLHEHVGDEHTEVFDVARLILKRHDLDAWLLGPRSLSWRGRNLQDSALLFLHPGWLYFRMRALVRHAATLRLHIVRGRDGLRTYPHLGLGGLRDDRRGGGIPPRCRHSGRSAGRRRVGRFLVLVPVLVEGGDIESDVGAGAVAGLRPVSRGKPRRRVLGARVDVSSLAALRRGRKRRDWRGRREGGLWGGRRVESP